MFTVKSDLLYNFVHNSEDYVASLPECFEYLVFHKGVILDASCCDREGVPLLVEHLQVLSDTEEFLGHECNTMIYFFPQDGSMHVFLDSIGIQL